MWYPVPQMEYRLVPLASEPDPVTSAVYRLSEGHRDADRAEGPCPTLRRCLGHRACAFRFSNEFCGQDAYPGRRKVNGQYSVG